MFRIMEAKKNPRSDVQRRYGLHLSIGFVIALAFVVTAFEWRTAYDKPIQVSELESDFIELDDIPLTDVPEPPKSQLVMPELIEVPEDEPVEEIAKVLDYDQVLELPEENFYMEPLEEEEAPEILDFVESMPEPVGGMDAFMAYLAKNIRYPKSGQRMGVQGRVFVQFIVNESGELTDIRVIKGINEDFDSESLRVLKNAPKWTPGKQRGRPVKVRMVIPIVFRLN